MWTVKSEALASEAERIFGEKVNVTIEGKRHLGAVIGAKNYKDQDLQVERGN